MRFVPVVLLVSALVGPPAFAAPVVAPSAPTPSTVRVNGTATLRKAPDLAEIDLGVVTRAKTAAAAAQDNAKKLERVLAAVKQSVGGKGDVSTVGYAATPQYRQPKEGSPPGAPVIDGYLVTNLLRVRLRAIADAGKVIDAALAQGANDVQRLSFGLANDRAAHAEALEAAAREARAKAEALAASLGLRITRALAVEDNGGGPRPFFAEAAMMKSADRAATPIEPGTVEVQANVSVTFEAASRAGSP